MSDIDALMVNFFTDELTRRAAERLASCVNLLVWDNSATLRGDDLPASVRLFKTGENLMYAAASNLLFQQSSSPYVLLINPDAIVDERHVERLREALDHDRGAWGAAPRLVDLDGNDQNYRRRLPTMPSLLVDRVPFASRVFPHVQRRHYYLDAHATDLLVEQPAAACLLLRRDLLDDPLFDEGYPLFGNDTDLARRLNQRGHCRYVRDTVVSHVGGASIAVARTRHRAWVRAEYERALRTYARRHVPGSLVLEPVFALRLLCHRVSARFAHSSTTPPRGASVQASEPSIPSIPSMESRAASAI
jgi:GT2 family glycosyltransferase